MIPGSAGKPPSTYHAQAIILNRTQIYAAARRHISLGWPLRIALRIAPMLLFLHHILSFLQAIRCQTSPHYSFLKYGKRDKHVDLDFSGDAGFLYHLASAVLFWENDGDSCMAVDFIPSRSEPWDRKGSLSLLWPFFRSLCFGQLVETLSCAVQGRPLMTETGMTIFEHSLAFAESESMISNRLGFSWLGYLRKNVNRSSPSKPPSSGDVTVTKLFTRNEILEKMNTPPEVLLMSLISSLNNFSSQVLGVFDMQARYRLINTGIWGLCFMSAFLWGLLSLRPESGPDAIILRFPTVCIVGFIPHLLVLVGIMICGSIYSLALLLCFLSPSNDEPRPATLADRFRFARENMQANAQLTNIRFNMHEDFYTALLKIGFSALTIASEAVYLNEGQRIGVARFTWLEDDRMREVEAFARSNDPSRRLGVQLGESSAEGKWSTREPQSWRSGYDRMTTVKAVRDSRMIDPRMGSDGVGHAQRGGRYLMAAQFFRGIFWLWISWLGLIINAVLDKIGIAWRPEWLKRSKRIGHIQRRQADQPKNTPDFLEFWMLSDDGTVGSPKNDDVDVASEMRQRLQISRESWGEAEERDFELRTYEWWRNGGWWGEKDESGSYQAPVEDDDITSVISMSTVTSDNDEDASGRSTPTQLRPYPQNRSTSPTPSIDHADNAFDADYLASLLNPINKEARAEARMLAYHLTSPRITTRSQYRRVLSNADTKLLTSTRHRPPNTNLPANGPLSPDEEAQLLEHLILTRRSKPLPGQSAADTWREGAAGMGQGGPQCVVCQSSPRTILAWPCRCLSLCEECRLSLAMNNFGTCVCCRQDVVGFSRLFVP